MVKQSECERCGQPIDQGIYVCDQCLDDQAKTKFEKFCCKYQMGIVIAIVIAVLALALVPWNLILH